MGDITVRSPRDLGALLRDARKRARLDQASLAAQIGVSRRWVIDAERGNPGAALGTMLRALDAVGVHLSFVVADANVRSGKKRDAKAQAIDDAVDIDAIVDNARRPKR